MIIALLLFGYFYNRRMGDQEDGGNTPTSFMVAGGVLFTLGIIALLSWKAAALLFLGFSIDGVFMIVGDVARAFERLKKETRNRKQRKPLPYAAASLIDEALMLLSDSQRLIKDMLKNGIHANQVGLAGVQIADAVQKLIEARKVEGE